MKIVSRLEFLKMPSGTLYQQCEEQWVFGDMYVKWDSLIYGADGDGDFVCSKFTDFDASSSEEWLFRAEDMNDNGASYPLDLDCAGRDGCFVRDAVFMVYEKADVLQLRDFFIRLASDQEIAQKAG